jgi:hypothetical protein
VPGRHAIPSGNRNKWHDLGDLAARQEGCAARWQLAPLGFTGPALTRAVAAGRLWRPFPGVYVPAGVRLTRLGEFMAAVLACGPTAVLSHQSAAHVYEFRRHDYGWPHVTVPRTGTRKRTGIHAHTSPSLDAHAVTSHGPFVRITTPARTLADLKSALTASAFESALAAAERHGLVNGYDLGHRPVYTRSQNERAFLRILDDHGLPRPFVNVDLGRDFEADFYWPDHALVVEIDAYSTHGNPRAFETDRLKDEYFELELGLRVRRITDQRLHREPAAVAAVVRRALSLARGGGPRR